jgi:WXG100 family type VII secretion target
MPDLFCGGPLVQVTPKAILVRAGRPAACPAATNSRKERAVANVHVDYQELQRSSSQLKSGQQDVESQLARLKSMIDNLVASGFVTDQASGKFQQSYDQWNSGAKNVIQGLQGMSSFLEKAIAQHQQLDSELSKST